jgi:hypothetical protein
VARSTELVERLRAGPIRTGDSENGEYELFDIEEAAQTMAEAADELTALTAKVALLTEALRPFGKLGDIPEHFDDAVKVQAGIDYTMDAEEVESLQELSGGALTSDRATLIVSIDGLTAGDFRRARALSEPEKNET